MNFLFALIAFVSFAGAASAQQRVDLPSLQMSIALPDDWERVSRHDAIAAAGTVQHPDAEAQTAITLGAGYADAFRMRSSRAGAGLPVMTFAADFQFFGEGQTPHRLLSRLVDFMETTYPPARIVARPAAVLVGDHAGTRARISYTFTFTYAGRSVGLVSEYWVIPNRDRLHLVTITMAPSQPEIAFEHARAILASLQPIRS